MIMVAQDDSIQNRISHLHAHLLRWYRKSKRDLPWRRTKDPYLIWVSEVMLQQTRVDTVIDYYHRFTEKFPTVSSLAIASEHDVLREWQGLGYYRRAKLIHTAAKTIAERYNGKLPETRNELANLPGFGPYTSGAVASIAFDEPVPAVDGNVKRVLSRIFATNNDIEDIALQAALPKGAVHLSEPFLPSDWSQALMELGALICVPKNPKCLICPVREDCKAFETQIVDQFPIKSKKPIVKELFSTISMIENRGKILIQQRGTDGRYAGMWEFPTEENIQKQNTKNSLGSFVHILTHRTIRVDVVEKKLNRLEAISKNQKWISPEQISEYPFSRMQLKALEIWKNTKTKD